MNFDFIAATDMLGKVFWVCAIFGSLFFIVRIILMLLGNDFDSNIDDLDHGQHMSTHSDAAFQLISINSLTAFIMMFGWGGLAAYIQYSLGNALSIIIATGSGFIAMFIIALLFKLAAGLTSKGAQFNIEDTVGLNASVYQRIPATGSGKVNVSMPGGILKELDAVSEDKVQIDSFKPVKVVKIVDNKTISVRQI